MEIGFEEAVMCLLTVIGVGVGWLVGSTNAPVAFLIFMIGSGICVGALWYCGRYWAMKLKDKKA